MERRLALTRTAPTAGDGCRYLSRMAALRRPTEHDSASDLRLPSLGRALRLTGRALRLRCPNCGGGPVLRHWFRMRDRCGRCGIRVERGERDYFIGSMMFNLVMGELLVVLVLVGVMIARWPRVPWDLLEVGVPAMALLFPAFLFPFSKLVWLGFDLMLRPATDAEMQWHDAGGSDSFHRPPSR